MHVNPPATEDIYFAVLPPDRRSTSPDFEFGAGKSPRQVGEAIAAYVLKQREQGRYMSPVEARAEMIRLGIKP